MLSQKWKDSAGWLILFLGFCALCTALLLARGAFAQEVQIGKGLLCDTAEQAARFVALNEKDAATAIQNVNAEYKETACAVMPVAYVRGAEVSTIQTAAASFAIVEIAIVGVFTPFGPRPVPPHKQYTIFAVKETKT